MIEEWRELTKLVNTYLGPLPTLIGEDGRLHTTINQTVAATGRLSTTSPNLQAIPIRTELGREIRSAFVAEPGSRLLSADYSQIELRILAHVSGEPKLREAFARGEDIHTATAAEVLGKDPATLTKDERNVAKMINFGIVYGISAFGLSENLDIPKEQAQAYIDAYLARFPLVQAFIARTIAQASEDGYATSLLGRRRPVPELRAMNRQTRGFGERVAVNFVMQGSNADIIKVAMVAIHERLRAEGRSARLVLQVHDELLLEVPETEVSKVRELVREEMVGAYPLDPPLAVDIGVGDDWAEAKSLRSVDGYRTSALPLADDAAAAFVRRVRRPARSRGSGRPPRESRPGFGPRSARAECPPHAPRLRRGLGRDLRTALAGGDGAEPHDRASATTPAFDDPWGNQWWVATRRRRRPRLERLAVLGHEDPGMSGSPTTRVEEAVVERLHVDGDDRRDARDDLAHVVGAHHDESALDELGAARVHDGDARPVARDRLLDLLVPDGVAGEVEVVEDEAAHRREELGDPAEPCARGARDAQAVPLERVVDRPRIEPELAQRLLVLRLAEDGNVARQQLLAARVEVVAVPVRHDDGVEAADDLLRRERQRRGRIRHRVARPLDRRPRAHVVEHRIDQDPRPAISTISVALRTSVMRTASF